MISITGFFSCANIDMNSLIYNYLCSMLAKYILRVGIIMPCVLYNILGTNNERFGFGLRLLDTKKQISIIWSDGGKS